MAENLLDRVRRYHDALNAVDLALVETMFAATAEYHSPGTGSVFGRYAIMAAMRKYFAEYPDQVASSERARHAGPHSVSFDWRLEATSKSTGRSLRRQGSETLYFDHQGLIRRVEVEDRC